MNPKKTYRVVQAARLPQQWKMQQLFGQLAARLNCLPDAAEVKKDTLRSAPAPLTEMVF